MKMEAWLKRGFPAAANLQSKSRILFMIKSIIEKTRKTLRDCQVKVMNVKMKLMKGNMK
jgi:uncharacterized protein (DUF1778 family)